MNASDFKRVWAVATDDNIDLCGENINVFLGCGWPKFKPVCVTIKQVAKFLMWQAKYIGSGWDMELVNEVRDIGRKKFTILD